MDRVHQCGPIADLRHVAFYAVLLTTCQQVAQVLGELLERVAVEKVFRALYHDSRAVERGAGLLERVGGIGEGGVESEQVAGQVDRRRERG